MPDANDPNRPGWALLPEFTRLLLLAVVLPALALAVLILWRGNVAVREQTSARLLSAADASGREIDAFLRAHLAALEVLAERRGAGGDLDDAAAWSADLRRIHAHYPAFATLLVASPDGRLLLSVPALPAAAGRPSVADRDYFREPRRSGRAHVSDAFRGRALGSDPLVAVSAPLQRDGRFAGVVEGSVPIESLSLSLRDSGLRERGYELLLLDRNDTVVRASAGLPYRPLQALGDGALRRLASAGGRTVERLPEALRDGSDAYAVSLPLDVGWRLVLLRPARLATAELRRNVLGTLALVALVALGVLAIVGLKMRQLGGSVRDLLGRMQGFALDRAPAPIPGDDLPRELAPLAEAMNALAARARASYDEVAGSLQEQRLLREDLQAMAQRLLTVQEDERRTLSRELHDDIGQAITAMKLGATALADDDPLRQEIVDEIVAVADQTAVKLRNLSLLLRPPQLDSLGLEPALRGQVDRLARKGRVAIALGVAPMPDRPPQAVELACFRIAQEALTNAMRHSGAGRIDIVVEADWRELRLEVRDDGRGFDPAHARGLGLLTMRERAQQLGGALEIDAAPGGGTRVRATLPLADGGAGAAA